MREATKKKVAPQGERGGHPRKAIHPLRRVTDEQELSSREGRARQISEKESWESRHRKERKKKEEKRKKRGKKGDDSMNKKKAAITNAYDLGQMTSLSST